MPFDAHDKAGYVVRVYALDPRHGLEAKLLVKPDGVEVCLSHLSEDPFHAQLIEWIIEGDEQHVPVQPEWRYRASVYPDAFARIVGEQNPANKLLVDDTREVDIGLGVEVSAGDLCDHWPILPFIQGDAIRHLVVPALS